MTTAITCNAVAKAFGEGAGRQQVLHGIDLDITAGQLAMIAGPSGCGKTTLLSILACTLAPSDGRVEVFGKDLSKLSGRQMTLFRRHHIGFIFQQYNLIPALTAAENAAMPLVIAGVNQRDAVASARRVLGKFDLGAHTEKLPRQLSGGQQQRVAVARALVHRPALIICDEPTAALDAQSGMTVMEVLKGISSSKNRLVLVVTHDHRIFSYADTLIEMEDGRIQSAAEPMQKRKAA